MYRSQSTPRPPGHVGQGSPSESRDWAFPQGNMQAYPSYPSSQSSYSIPQHPGGTPSSHPTTPQYTQLVQSQTPSPTLVQLGAAQNYLINSQPAPYIQVLDVDPNYHRSREPSPSKSPRRKFPHSYLVTPDFTNSETKQLLCAS